MKNIFLLLAIGAVLSLNSLHAQLHFSSQTNHPVDNLPSFGQMGDDGMEYQEIRHVLLEMNIPDIEKSFGKPENVQITPSQEKRLYKSGNKRLVILIDRTAESQDFSFRFHQKRDVKSSASVEDVRAIANKITDVNEIRYTFGKPAKIKLTSKQEWWYYEFDNGGWLKVQFNPDSELVINFTYQE